MEKLHIKTPLLQSQLMTKTVGKRTFIKFENFQPGGSFKIRGIGQLCQKAKTEGYSVIVSSSGGNAGAAATYAGVTLGMEVNVLVPSTTPDSMVESLRSKGAHVEVHGDVWDETDQEARILGAQDKHKYVSPFNDKDIWAGNASIIHEIKDQLNEKPAAIVVSVGGGGLLLGILQGLTEVGWGDVAVIAVETEGARSFNATFETKRLVTLDRITSVCTSLGAKCVAEGLLPYVRERENLHSVVVTDVDAVNACFSLIDEFKTLVEPACGACLSLGYGAQLDRVREIVKDTEGPMVMIGCGGNMCGPEKMLNYREKVKY